MGEDARPLRTNADRLTVLAEVGFARIGRESAKGGARVQNLVNVFVRLCGDLESGQMGWGRNSPLDGEGRKKEVVFRLILSVKTDLYESPRQGDSYKSGRFLTEDPRKSRA